MSLLTSLAVILVCLEVALCSPLNATENTTEKPSEKTTEHPLDQSYAEDILQSFEKQLNEWQTKRKTADWNYETNLTDANLQAKLEVLEKASEFQKKVRDQVAQLKWQELPDEGLRRQFCRLSMIGPQVLPEKLFVETEQILSTAERLYNTLTICDYKDPKKCNLTLTPELTEIMANSRDPDELKHVWTKWHDLCGKTMLPNFPRYVGLLTEAAKLQNLTDITQWWLRDYGDNFTDQVETLWLEVKPFYLQLHAYVRSALRKKYGENLVPKGGPIPVHLLGDMWSKKWSYIANMTAPFPEKRPIDITEEMIKQGCTAENLYCQAETAFVSMGLPALPETFWEKSILTKPLDRNIVCDAAPWDFNDGKTFLVSKCNRITMENLREAINQVGVIQYFMQYKDQRYAFKHPANPGFREAIGDLVALSVMTPSHLAQIGLLKVDNLTDPELVVNNLYYKALDRVVTLPYAFVTEKWRWDVYRHKINSNQYNCHWWKLGEDIQGVKPPVERSNTDFDPGAEYHVAVDYTYLRYFVSTILQFQLHKQLCTEIGEFKPGDPNSKPLHLCDITASTQAGEKLKAGMKLGSSKPWQDVLETITGQRQMEASGLLEYFKPLHDWLKQENLKNNENIGWHSSQKAC